MLKIEIKQMDISILVFMAEPMPAMVVIIQNQNQRAIINIRLKNVQDVDKKNNFTLIFGTVEVRIVKKTIATLLNVCLIIEPKKEFALMGIPQNSVSTAAP